MVPATPVQQGSRDAPVALSPWQIASDRIQDDTARLGWLTARRSDALARLDSTGLPDTRQENWRYTSLAGYTQRWIEYLAAETERPVAPEVLVAAGDAVTLLDGILQNPPSRTPPGLTIHSLQQLPPEWHARVEGLFDQAEQSPDDNLVDLNTALLGDVILIATTPGSRIDQPVHVRLHDTSRRAMSQPRLLVDVAPDSHLTLSLEHTGTGGALVNAVTQVCIGRNGHLNLLRVQDLPADGMLTETTIIDVAESASVAVTSLDMGSQLTRQAMTIRLAGTGASATVHGLFLADGHRHIDTRTRLEHAAPGTTSREYFRGLADDHGHGVFNGTIIVQPGADGSIAALTNRNLLLTNTAEIDTKPELEIYTDDVRCSHGATTGQLDPNALFYLRSRGLDPAAARQVLTTAFMRESLAGIAEPALKARLEVRLETRLQQGQSRAGSGGKT